MRKLTSLAALAALFSASWLISAPSQAMTPGSAAGVKGAAATLDPVEKTACWRYGVYGWVRAIYSRRYIFRNVSGHDNAQRRRRTCAACMVLSGRPHRCRQRDEHRQRRRQRNHYDRRHND